jgi:hypothetical protein
MMERAQKEVRWKEPDDGATRTSKGEKVRCGEHLKGQVLDRITTRVLFQVYG